MEKYICDCCGGQINRATMKCEYCGTAYRDTFEDRLVRIETYDRCPVKTIRAAFSISREHFEESPEHMMGYVAREMAAKITEEILPRCQFQADYDPVWNRFRIYSQCKVVEPIDAGVETLSRGLSTWIN